MERISVVIATKSEEKNTIDSGWYPDYIIRPFRKGVARWPLEIHDVLKIKEKDKAVYLGNPMSHISYTSHEQYLDKSARYTTRLAQEEYEKGVRITKTNFLLLFLVKPLSWFFRKYFLLRGCKDGFRGFFICVASTLTMFMTYAKLWERDRKN